MKSEAVKKALCDKPMLDVPSAPVSFACMVHLRAHVWCEWCMCVELLGMYCELRDMLVECRTDRTRRSCSFDLIFM